LGDLLQFYGTSRFIGLFEKSDRPEVATY